MTIQIICTTYQVNVNNTITGNDVRITGTQKIEISTEYDEEVDYTLKYYPNEDGEAKR